MRRPVQALIVLLILLLAGALLLPSLLRLRETSHAYECQRNLRQIGIALDDYHSSFEQYPPTRLPNPGLPPEKQLSWIYNVDPYLISRMSAEWSRGRRMAWDAKENHDIIRERQTLFLCPANANQGEPGEPGLTHYVGITGLGVNSAWLPKSDRYAGVFGDERSVARRDIVDGLGTTMLVAETGRDNGPWAVGGYPTSRTVDPFALPYFGSFGQFSSGHLSPASLTRRRHVTNVLFADGSVRRVAEGTDNSIFEALATFAGRESIPPNWEQDP